MGMKQSYSVRINPNGDIFFVYNDDQPLLELGSIDVARASNVHLNVETQKWEVWLNYPDQDPAQLARTFKKRKDAIAFEVEFLNERINELPVAELF